MRGANHRAPPAGSRLEPPPVRSPTTPRFGRLRRRLGFRASRRGWRLCPVPGRPRRSAKDRANLERSLGLRTVDVRLPGGPIVDIRLNLPDRLDRCAGAPISSRVMTGASSLISMPSPPSRCARPCLSLSMQSSGSAARQLAYRPGSTAAGLRRPFGFESSHSSKLGPASFAPGFGSTAPIRVRPQRPGRRADGPRGSRLCHLGWRRARRPHRRDAPAGRLLR